MPWMYWQNHSIRELYHFQWCTLSIQITFIIHSADVSEHFIYCEASQRAIKTLLSAICHRLLHQDCMGGAKQNNFIIRNRLHMNVCFLPILRPNSAFLNPIGGLWKDPVWTFIWEAVHLKYLMRYLNISRYLRYFEMFQLPDISSDYRYVEISLEISWEILDALRYLLIYFQISPKKMHKSNIHWDLLNYILMYLRCWEISFYSFSDMFWHIPRYLILKRYTTDPTKDVLRYLERFKISWFVFRYLKLAKDIFWSRPVQVVRAVLRRRQRRLLLPAPAAERSISHSHGGRSRSVRSTAWRASQGAMFSWEVVLRHRAWLGVGIWPKRKPALSLLATSGNRRSHQSSTSRSACLQFLQSCCPSRALYIATRSQ